MNVHLSAQTQTEGVEGEIPLATFKKYIAYARTKCGPRLSAAAAEKLKNRYVVMRSGAREHERETDKRPSIPITVRYFYMLSEHLNTSDGCISFALPGML